jgi:DNA-binding GntR family transcriptional regulator
VTRPYRQVFILDLVELDRDGEIPISRQLAGILRVAIEAGDIPPGRPVPSKRTLIEEYGIAGSTVDKAMQILKDAGMIRTAKGLGLFVVPKDERPGPDRG